MFLCFFLRIQKEMGKIVDAIRERSMEEDPPKDSDLPPAKKQRADTKTVSVWKQRLYGPEGMRRLVGVNPWPTHRPKGPGHEVEDLEAVLRIYREFFHQTFPKVACKDVLNLLRNATEAPHQLFSLENEGKMPPEDEVHWEGRQNDGQEALLDEEAPLLDEPLAPLHSTHHHQSQPLHQPEFALYNPDDSEPDDALE